MRILAIIPARGGSKGVPRKNLRPLAGKPLIAHTISVALAAPSIDRTVVSTEDDEIAEVSAALGAEVVRRPPELASDAAPTLPSLQHVVSELAADSYHPDAVATLQATSPLRTVRHVEEAVALFRADPGADSLVSCVPVPHIFHPRSVMRRTEAGYLEPYLGNDQPTQRQGKEPVFARNGAAIYLTRTPRLKDFVFGGRLVPYFMDEEASLDIDTPDDFDRAEAMLRGST